MANLKIGDTAIAFSLPNAGTVGGNEVAYKNYGHTVARAVIFHCNHCPYAQAWEDRMVEIQEDYAGKGVQIIAVSSNDAERYPADSFAEMKRRAREKGYNFPYLYDESQEVGRAYGAERTPEVFLFDQTDTLRYHGAIDDNYEEPDAVTEHYLRDAIDAVLEGHSPATETTPPVGCSIKWKGVDA